MLYIPSGHASVLAYTMPLWVALIGFVVFRQRLTGRLLVAIRSARPRWLALMLPNFASYASAPAGLFWGLFAGFCWAIGTFVVKRTAWPGMGLSLTFWQIVISLPPIALGVADRRPARAMALDRRARRHDLHRRHPDGAGHRDLVRPGQAAADAGRGAVVDRHPDRRDRQRRAPARTNRLSALQAVAIGSTVVSLWLALVPPRGALEKSPPPMRSIILQHKTAPGRNAVIQRRTVIKASGALALGASPLQALAQTVTLPFDNGERPIAKYPQKRPMIGLTSRPPQLETPFAVFNEA